MSAVPPDFARIAGALDQPMFIVTARSARGADGCLVGFATQASIDPARFLACLSKANRTYAIACAADVLVVHVVPRAATALAELFGGHSGDDTDKLARCDWSEGPDGAPILAGCPAWFAGRVLERVDLGDHVGFLLEPVRAHAGDGGPALGMRRAMAIDSGHEA